MSINSSARASGAPGVVFESVVHKKGGVRKNLDQQRVAAVVDVKDIGRVFQWKKVSQKKQQIWLFAHIEEKKKKLGWC
jgi:hypothetical protein